MLDPQIVEHGDTWPHCCAICKSQGSATNPLVNTWVDLNGAFTPDAANPMTGAGYGRLYICKKICLRSMTRVAGFSQGKKLDELQNASESLAFKEKEIAARDEQIQALTETIADRDRRLKQQQIVIDDYEKRDDTWRHQIGILNAHASEMTKVGS